MNKMNDNTIKAKVIKIGIIRNWTVGKTLICSALSGVGFTEDPMPTSGVEKYDTMYKLKNNKEIKIVFLDISWSERSYHFNFKYLKAVTGIILVIDVTNKKKS